MLPEMIWLRVSESYPASRVASRSFKDMYMHFLRRLLTKGDTVLRKAMRSPNFKTKASKLQVTLEMWIEMAQKQTN